MQHIQNNQVQVSMVTNSRIANLAFVLPTALKCSTFPVDVSEPFWFFFENPLLKHLPTKV